MIQSSILRIVNRQAVESCPDFLKTAIEHLKFYLGVSLDYTDSTDLFSQLTGDHEKPNPQITKNWQPNSYLT